MSRLWLPLALCALPVFIAGCDGETADVAEELPGEPGPAPAAEGPTWHQDIAPIVAQRCGACHVEGGAAPFALDTVEMATAMAPASLSAIESGRMPPWLPDPDCRTFENERLMPADEVELFRAWVEAGTPLGDAATAAPIVRPEPPTFEPTHVLASEEPFLPSNVETDDYRCFVLPMEFEEDHYLTAGAVWPDVDAIVHHVLVYSVEPDMLGPVLAADAESPEPGYRCYGGPLPSTGDNPAGGLPTQIAGWVPGSDPQILDEGVAVPIRAGSRIVMQVHYNTMAMQPEPDATELALRLTTEPPEQIIVTRPLLIRTLDIPAGEPAASHVRMFRNYTDRPLTLAAMTPHMHQLGDKLTATIERADNSEECLVDIPKWDFNWQTQLQLGLGDAVTLMPGDGIRLECIFDNSPANQPFVDGAQIDPRDVSWGDGTLDEMCMLYLTLVEDFVPAPIDPCAAGTACLERCAADGTSTADCIMTCEMPMSCKTCALSGSFDCGAAACTPSFIQLRETGCLESCFINNMAFGGDMTACFNEVCSEPYQALASCLDGVLDSGACDANISACGFDLTAP